MKALIKYSTTVLWLAYCIWIISNVSHYSLLGCIIVIIIAIAPFVVYFFVKKFKHNQKTKINITEHTLSQEEKIYPSNSPLETTESIQQPITYILNKNVITRSDGKTITDEEIPHLMTMGYRQALEADKLRPSLSPKDDELVYQFMLNHGSESQKRCDKFEHLNSLAFNETNIDKKIELLRQTVAAFEAAKHWHYTYSKGAKLYFQVFWEQLHNSRCACFSWIDSVKDELELQLYKRNEIIPWIIENSKTGFLQTAIYKEFLDVDKSVLRKSIDELANQSILLKNKKGSSYFITYNLSQSI